METKTLMGFSLPCMDCGETLLTGYAEEKGLAKYTNEPTTAYWAADADEGDKPVGYSQGTGDTFRCKLCHAFRWRTAPETVAALGAISA